MTDTSNMDGDVTPANDLCDLLGQSDVCVMTDTSNIDGDVTPVNDLCDLLGQSDVCVMTDTFNIDGVFFFHYPLTFISE